MIGNQLRELDRFLSLLLDEAALSLGSPKHDSRAFAQLRNTAYKLSLVEAMTGFSTRDHARLRAIGQVSACLHHCSGMVHAPGMAHHVRMAQGQPEPDTQFGCGGGTLRLSAPTIISICEFYRNIADRLVAEASGAVPSIDYRDRDAHIAGANVACDGI